MGVFVRNTRERKNNVVSVRTLEHVAALIRTQERAPSDCWPDRASRNMQLTAQEQDAVRKCLTVLISHGSLVAGTDWQQLNRETMSSVQK